MSVDPRTELSLDGTTWTDVTGWVREDTPVEIGGRGRTSEQSATLEPTSLTLTLDNRDGRFSPRNPRGPWYGQIGRNTPIRVSVPAGETYALLPGDAEASLLAPYDPSVALTGDLDMRIDLDAESWRTPCVLASRWSAGTGDRSWLWTLHGTGRLRFFWTPDGGTGNIGVASSTTHIPATGGRLCLRVTLDVDNGAGGSVVTFHTGPTIGGPWTVLGDSITLGATTSVHAGNADLEACSALSIGGDSVETLLPACGRLHGFQLRDGIGGSLAADLDVSAAAPGDGAIVDGAGLTWVVMPPAEVTDRDYRAHAEVSSWAPRWAPASPDVRAQVEAAGITRRLGQGDAPVASTLKHALLQQGDLVAYWPCEDGQDSTQIASAIEGHPAMAVTIEQPDYANFDGFACSDPLPTLTDSQWMGTVPAYDASGGTAQLRWLFHIDAGVAGERVITLYFTGGSLQRVAVFYGGTGGDLAIRAHTWDGTQVLDTGYMDFNINDRLSRMALQATQIGADVEFALVALDVGQTVGQTATVTLSSQTFGRVSGVGVNAGGGLTTGTAVFGHISVHNRITSIFDLRRQMDAWTGELAAHRIIRLCREQGVPVVVLGNPDGTAPMGPQRSGTLLELLDECARADGGILYEPRWRLALAYRTRQALYNLDPTLELEFGQDRELGELAPVDDDQATRNAVTITRQGGSSAVAELEAGTLSIQPPPNGVGRYETSETVNVLTDDQLRDIAGWRLHLGTVDEARHPSIPLTLWDHAYTTPAQVEAARRLDVGGRLTITSPPPWLPPAAIDQMAVGLSETITSQTHYGRVVGAPYAPWRVATADDPVLGRADTSGSELATDITASSTTFTVAITSGPEWIWEPATEFPFDILVGGEVMRVTAVAGPTWTFETDTHGWSAADCTITRSTTRAWTGPASALLTTTGTPTQNYARPTGTHRALVTPGTAYATSFRAYSVAGHGTVAAAIDWFTGAGGYITTSTATKALPAATWTHHTLTSVAPANAAAAGYGPTIGGSPGAGTEVWFDHVEFGRIERQIFTVQRGINGITKPHPAGTPVRLAQPMTLAL
ncbi:hypothetical protein LO762_16410 [Actinocorallia sp. API 0066]|uniref:hypothetical protein n=1 Tax=Actinocorallia sp. API 0066 TaxID=2896846 RepID=UPI001E4710E8|nr:hypothetical protein [Actinocorallia sp. API 0066]MCD0450761.1 hypothetical protein [Actinocorallia sp. API 0066]